MIRHSAAALAIFLGFAVVPAWADDFAVIDSSVPALPAGATVSSGTTLDVPAKDHVVLVASSGAVVTIKGPYHGLPKGPGAARPGATGSDVVTILAALVANNGERQTAGVARGVVRPGAGADTHWRRTAATTPAAILTIDASDGGDACIENADGAALVHNPALSGEMSIQAMDGSGAAKVVWPANTLSAPWPKTLSIIDGNNYLFQQAGENAVAVATIHVLPRVAGAGPVARALAVAKAGCRVQARLLVALIAKAAQ